MPSAVPVALSRSGICFRVRDPLPEAAGLVSISRSFGQRTRVLRRNRCLMLRRPIPQLPVGSGNDHSRDGSGQDIGHGHGVQDTVQSEEHQQKQCEAHTKYDLPDHGKHGRFHGLSHGLKEDECRLVHACENHHAQVDAERPDGKLSVVDTLAGRAEDLNQDPWKTVQRSAGQPRPRTPRRSAVWSAAR